ncbi:MAG TPA: hypothetical protein VL463_10170 [Kofleriaceae bacterium]|nr:hypothetical protein [Kofleriaceae bacterium]
MPKVYLRFAFGAALVASACGGNDNPGGIKDQCNPLGGTACLQPWPSSLYLKPDATTKTGYRVALPIEAMPTNTDDIAIDPAPFNRWDGFSPSGPIVASFSTGVSADGLPPYNDIQKSLAADSPVVLLDLDTGDRAPFFAEVDMNAPDPTQRALIIRPMIRLAPKHHYGVGVRTAVHAADGGPLPIAPAFADLVAGKPATHPLLAGHEAEFQELFAKLETAGVPRTDLVLAWDFRTASDEFLTSDLLTMRDLAIPAIGTNGANLSFTAHQVTVSNPVVHALYEGTFKSPNFLTAGENLGSVITRGADGLPSMSGMRDANFAAVIPKCTETMNGPVPVMVFGHGLFGSGANYLDDDFLQSVSNDFCFVIVAGDFIGLTSRQLQLAATAANDFNMSGSLAEMLEQSVVDFIALEQLVRGPLKDAPEFQVNGHSVIDPTQVYYLGGSLGGIMGNTFMAYDPNILRGGLGVPGGVWSMMFERSQAWSLLQGPAESSYPDFYEAQNLIAFLGMRMEPVDPVTTATHVLADPLPGTPVKQLDLYETLGDCLVNNLATETMARTMKLKVIGPSLKQPWGLEVTTDPQANALTIYDEHRTPLPPTTNVPPATDNGTHSGVNKRAAVLRQVHDFLLGGSITNQCLQGSSPAPCDCATGVCDGIP